MHNKNCDENEVVMESGIIIREPEVINQIKDYYYSTGNYRDLLLFLLGINTGLKMTEILSLNVVDLRGKDYIDIDSCNGGAKRIPLNEEIINTAKVLTKERDSDSPLFESLQGRRIDRTTVYRNFKEVCEKLNLGSGITLASLRKTFGYHYYKTYGDLSTLQWLFSQNSILDTAKYIELDEDMSSHFRVMNL